MAENKSSGSNLIYDSGVYDNPQEKNSRIFVFLCRVISVILIILGAAALIVGNS